MTCACAIKLTACIVTHFLPYIFQPINMMMKLNPPLSNPLKSFTAICLLGAGSLHAATVTWDAGTNSTWDTTTANWTGSAYTNGDDAQFLGAGAGTVTLTGVIDPGSVLVSSANDYTFSGAAITGTGALTKTGSGTLTLTANHSYTGGTIVNGGTLILDGGDQTLKQFSTLTVDGSSSLVQLGTNVGGNNIINNMVVNIKNGATVDDTTTTGYVQSMGNTTFTNGGTLSSTGAGYNPTYGNYFFNGNIAVNGNAAATISADAITINGARTITVDNVTGNADTDLTISSIIKDWTNPTQVIKNGAGTMTLSGNNTYTGGTTVNEGTLSMNSVNALGTGMITVNHATLHNGASGPSAISNNLTTTGWFYWGAGSQDLSIDGDWTNNSNILWVNSGGTLTFNGLVSGLSPIYGGGGTIAVTNSNNNFTGAPEVTHSSTLQFTTIANSGVNSSLGAGSQISFDSNATQNMNGYIENIGAGGSTNRTVAFGAHNGNNTAGIANNGTGALDFTGTFTNNSNTGATRTLLLGGDYGGQNSISSALSDGGNGGQLALTKEGATTWALSGINTYTGNTSINGGTLLINGDQSAATGTVTVNSGATLGAAGTSGKIGGDTTIAAGGAFTLVDGQVDSLLTLSGSLDITAIDPGSLKFELGAGEASDTVALNNLFMNSLELGDFEFTELSGAEAGTYTLFQVTQDYTADFGAGATGTLFGFNAELAKDNNNLVLNLTAVPEPSSTALLGLGGLALILRRRRDK